MTTTNSPARARQNLWQRVRASRAEYLFLVPGLAVFLSMIGYPLIASQWFSLFDWSGFDDNATFIGFGNYRELTSDPFFWGAFWRSFIFMLGTVPAQMVLSLIVALFLNNRLIKMRGLFRTVIFLPVVTPVAVIGIVMTLLLSPFNGPVNGFLIQSGLISRAIDFLGSPGSALNVLMVVYVWKWLGTTMIYWLAALQTVPDELYEVSQLEGVRSWQLTFYVILPLILPFAVVIALISAISALNVFPLIQSMTQGGPFFSTEVMEIYIFRNAFASDAGTVPRLGYASAAGVFFGLSIMVLTILQVVSVRWMRKRTQEHG